jgi:ABC-2 type transport system permease protein
MSTETLAQPAESAVPAPPARPLTEVFSRAVRGQTTQAGAWAASIVLLVVLVAALWPSLKHSSVLGDFSSSLPSGLAQGFGLAHFDTAAGYLEGNLYALLLPFMLSWMALSAVTEFTAGDEEAGRLELLLALPVSHRGVYLARLLAVLACVAAAAALMWLSVFVCCRVFGLDVGVVGLTAAGLMLFLLAAFHAAVSYAAAASGADRRTTTATASTVLVLGYVLQTIAPLAAPLRAVDDASPWRWALGRDPLSGGFDVPAVLLLAGATALLVGGGTLAVGRRDIKSA